MKKALLLASVLGVALASALATVGCNRIEILPADPPASVLLVTIDTLRADHVGAYGAEDVGTPVLDRLASEGVRFANAIAPTPITLPSHASLLTGLYPPSHGVRHNGVYRLGSEATTLAEHFGAAGYSTGAVVGAVVLAGQFGLAQGFDHYDDHVRGRQSSRSGYPERRAGEVTDRALAWLKDARDPFFLWVHYYDPHASYEPPEDWAKRFPGRPYDGEIAYVDAELGRLLLGARALGHEAPIVAVTSDHGESLGEHGERTHSVLVYDAVLRVPLILSGPGIPSGSVGEGVVSLVDLAPTLAGLAGLPELVDVEGRDLLTEMGSPRPRAEAEGWAYAESLVAKLTMGWDGLHTIRTSDYQYIQSSRPELFDLRSDPDELRDLLGVDASSAALSSGQRRWTEDAEQRLASLAEREIDRPMSVLDEATRAQIESLGYALPTPGAGGALAEPFSPRDGLDWIKKALAAHEAQLAGRLDLAEALARDVVDRFPQSQRGHDILTNVYLRTRRWEQAMHHAETLARLAPDWADHHARVGLTRMKTGDVPGAVQAFEQALARDPDHLGAHLGAMHALGLGGPLEDAREHASAVVRLAHQDRVFEELGRVWQANGRAFEARSAWETGLERFPTSERLRQRLAQGAPPAAQAEEGNAKP
ncbi:MAG: sulfatase-like hydrolase/transferase [bacterium]|nr:sulfatase-like hydrolase/transferase [bacterium]